MFIRSVQYLVWILLYHCKYIILNLFLLFFIHTQVLPIACFVAANLVQVKLCFAMTDV